jgi:Winged helix-turn helix
VAAWVESGPNLKTDGVVRWRCADLRDRIAAKFHVHLHERSVGKLLKKLNFSSMSVRPLHMNFSARWLSMGQPDRSMKLSNQECLSCY